MSKCEFAKKGMKLKDRREIVGRIVEDWDYCGALFQLEGLRASVGNTVYMRDKEGIRRPCLKCSMDHGSCPLKDAMKQRSNPIRGDSQQAYFQTRMKCVAQAYRIFNDRLRINHDWIRLAGRNGVTWPERY